MGSFCQLLAEELKQRGLVRLGEVRHVDDVCRAQVDEMILLPAVLRIMTALRVWTVRLSGSVEAEVYSLRTKLYN